MNTDYNISIKFCPSCLLSISLCFVCLGRPKDFHLIGDGWCRPNCVVSDSDCRINAYRKESSNYEECKSACIDEEDCTGFAISDITFWSSNGEVSKRCYVYGNISSEDTANWADPDVWSSYPYSTYGFEVYSTNGQRGIRCFKRLEIADLQIGKSTNF